MPVITLNPRPNPNITLGGYGATVPIFTPIGSVRPTVTPITQIAGLVPLVCITASTERPAFSKCDCREWANDDCYINPVFASTSDEDPFKNDHNMFLIEFPFFYIYQWTQASSGMSIEKWDGTQWVHKAYLIDNTYGIFYQFGKLGTNSGDMWCAINWHGYDIDWRLVLIAFGEGMYRFRQYYNVSNVAGSLVSEPFCLKEWSCAATDVTVRWESTIIGGSIGSITDDKRLFEFCCNIPTTTTTLPNTGGAQWNVSTVTTIGKTVSIIWKDQIRVYAFFGKEKTEYERVNIEYANGEIVQVRNEAIQKFEYESALQPKWVHDRLKAYAFMANELYATDYNWNNSDYEIKKKRVACDGSYEPEYNENTRFSNVKVQFKEGFQNVVRDNCCSGANRGVRPVGR